MASLTNSAKNSASLTNVPFGDPSLTWDQATFTWDAAPGTWDHQTSVVTNQAKNSASVANQAKN